MEAGFSQPNALIHTYALNFYSHMYEATGEYPPHACGVERYEILKAGYDIANRSLWVTIREKYEKRYEFEL